MRTFSARGVKAAPPIHKVVAWWIGFWWRCRSWMKSTAWLLKTRPAKRPPFLNSPEIARVPLKSAPTQTIAQGDYTLVALNQAGEEVASREITLRWPYRAKNSGPVEKYTPGEGLDANTLDGMSRADKARLTELAEETVSQEELDAHGIRSSILDDDTEFTNRVGMGMKPSEVAPS